MKISKALAALAFSVGLLASAGPAHSSNESDDVTTYAVLAKGDVYYEVFPDCESDANVGLMQIILCDEAGDKEKEGGRKKAQKFEESLHADLRQIFPGHYVLKAYQGRSRKSMVQDFNSHTCRTFSTAQIKGAMKTLGENPTAAILSHCGKRREGSPFERIEFSWIGYPFFYSRSFKALLPKNHPKCIAELEP